MTATTAPQTTVATITTVPGDTTSGTGRNPDDDGRQANITTPGRQWRRYRRVQLDRDLATDCGEMTLSQSGNLVTGTYTHDNGGIEGTVSGNTLTGRWSESPSYQEPNDAGQFVFTMAPDCGSFTGTWGYGGCDSERWSGPGPGAARPEPSPPRRRRQRLRTTAATTTTTTTATTTRDHDRGDHNLDARR